jgi:3-oxoacyl-[acyl-carrier-protein] synthase-3
MKAENRRIGMKKRNAVITATGSYFPEKVIPNSHFESYLDTSDEWITTRTGIKERRKAEKGIGNSELAVKACKQALERRGMDASELDAIIVATVTPDMMFPATACLVQDKLGAKNAFGFDLLGACSGFVYAYSTASMMIESGRFEKIMVVGSEICSTFLDYNDRNTCVLFGDGAGAVIIEATDEDLGLIDVELQVDGSGGKYLYMPGGNSLNPATHETIDKNMHVVHQEGREVYKRAVVKMYRVTESILKRNNFSGKDLKLFVPHQANLRIIESVGSKLKLKDEQIMVNIHKYGNTTAATIPTCLDEASQNGTLKKGDLVCITAFGAGFTWGSALMRWGF